MADIEKDSKQRSVSSIYRSDDSVIGGSDGEVVRPATWKYHGLKIGKHQLPWYASPPSQLLIVSFVCFLCPGMFNALSGMGGGGQVDTTTADNANTTLYSVFAVVGFFAGTFTNKLGVRTALSIGGMGYCIYIASFLCYSHTQNQGFNIFAGAFLGVCAGLLWTAQGAIMMSYPNESTKGRYISWFWMIFNLGGVIGSLIPLGQNINVKTKSTVTDGTYIGFIVLTFLGACLAWLLTDSGEVIRSDGSHVIVMKHPTWKTELLGLFHTIIRDPWVVLLFPMFWSSNWFYTYQYNDFNNPVFSTRTSALNNLLYWTSQIIGAFVFGFGLDLRYFSRPTKAKIAWAMIFVLTMAIWGGGYAFQDYTRAQTGSKTYVPTDWTTSGYVGPMFLYMFYGFYDAAWQTFVYWTMGALTNNSRKLANMAGFYKGIQSAGAAVIFSIDQRKVPYINIFASCWALLGGSLIIAFPLVFFKVKDHVTIEEDLKFSDETYEDVAPQVDRLSEGRSSAHAMHDL
ncbi:MAG: hypothetical protein M1828_004344 [Chrysothrix sp. TS-e1954]|nr:MAG: hypothetical protein M1828_004344 [Chrysothrix sp. TS-e1954]